MVLLTNFRILNISLIPLSNDFYGCHHCSVGVGDTWGLSWEWGSLASVETGAPSSSLAESGSSALPGLNALLGTLPVVGLGDGAVVVVWSRFLVGSPVTLVEHLSVVEIEEVELVLTVWDLSGVDGNEKGSNNSDSSLHF